MGEKSLFLSKQRQQLLQHLEWTPVAFGFLFFFFKPRSSTQLNQNTGRGAANRVELEFFKDPE